MKKDREPITWITAYDYPFAYVSEKAGVDMILVGDSGGMVQLGYQTTNPVTMDEMISMAKAARRGAPNTFLVGDMPQGAYEVSEREAVLNALRFVKEAGCDAIKCEGGRRLISKFKAIIDAGILVVGHLGLTPQSTATFGGYRVQGKTIGSFDGMLEDALALQEAGVISILLEAIPTEPGEQIAKHLTVPILGIGAGSGVDGQLVIIHDLMGFYSSFRPLFAKCYIPEIIGDFSEYLKSVIDIKRNGYECRRDGMLVLAQMAVEKYVHEVRSRKFPSSEYCYPLKKSELDALEKSKNWIRS
jgi:3-methyl-2-oxobutanoate hydroxymethyltransferase